MHLCYTGTLASSPYAPYTNHAACLRTFSNTETLPNVGSCSRILDVY